MVANVDKMALIGAPSWHRLEEAMQEGATLDEWKRTAGLMHKVVKTPVAFLLHDSGGRWGHSRDKFVLYRDDTGADLSIVGPNYNVVQPGEIIDFFDSLIRDNGMKLETAGSLAGGKKVWALARTGNDVKIGGVDLVKQYLLLATSYDKSIETTGKHTAIRVVCQNTLNIAIGSGEPAVKVSHRTVFNDTAVKIELGVLDLEWAVFSEEANKMHGYKVKKASVAARWFAELLTEEELTDEQVLALCEESKPLRSLLKVFREGKGAEPTAWGLVNGVTAFVDHMRGRTPDSGLNSAWFGAGAALKQKARDKGMALVMAG